MNNTENIFYMDHPLIQHKISMLRDKRTGTNEFRKLVEEIAVLMGVHVSHGFGKGQYVQLLHSAPALESHLPSLGRSRAAA